MRNSSATGTEGQATAAQNHSLLLGNVDWRVWILGYGLGGCAGVATLVGVWSLVVDDSVQAGLIALAIGLLHGIAITVFWSVRDRVSIRLAAYTCALVGAIGLASTAYGLSVFRSSVPGGSSLYCLAVMAIGMGMALPNTAQLSRSRAVPTQK